MAIHVDFPKRLKTITTKLPTFLHCLLREDCNIRLSYREKAVISYPDVIEEPLHLPDHQKLDLTGSPLKTDLGEHSDSKVNFSNVISSSWTTEEADYYPISLPEARCVINKLLRDGDLKGKPIYCICDGNDGDRTIILGTMQTEKAFTRILVHILPNFTEEDLKIENLLKNHSKKFTQSIKSDCIITDVYYLVNQNLKNSNCLEASEVNGSVALEVTLLGASEAAKRTYRPIIQVIIGHSSSLLWSFWEELSLIEQCMNMLGTPEGNSPKTQFSGSYLRASDLVSEICEALQSIKPPKNDNSRIFDLKNLRNENFMDILWNILRRCNSLEDIRDSFHAFFEELVAMDTVIPLVRDDDKSTLSTIIIEIVKGRRAVPTLSYSQSLELFVELGLEKLKRDYIAIITHLYPIIEEDALKKWNECQPKTGGDNYSQQVSKRKTRCTIAPNCAATDLAISKKKLSFLYNLHVFSEFMLLYKEHLKTVDSDSDDFAQNLYSKFVVNEGHKFRHLMNFRSTTLLEYDSEINTFNHSTLEGKNYVSQTVKLTSRIGSTDVTTIYHISKYPIFPPSIWDYYRDENKTDYYPIIEDEIPNKYVTKLLKLVTHR